MRTFLIVVILVWLAIAGLTVLVGTDPGRNHALRGVDVPTPVVESALSLVVMLLGIAGFTVAGLSIFIGP